MAATDEPLGSAKTNMGLGLGMALAVAHQQGPPLLRRSEHVLDGDDDNDLNLMEKPGCDFSQSAKTDMHMGEEMALVVVVHQWPSDLLDDDDDDDDDDLNLMQKQKQEEKEEEEEEELSIVVRQVDASQVEYVPLRIVRPESEETAQERCPVFRYEQRPKITITYTRRRTRPGSSHPAKSKKELDSGFFDSSSGSKASKDVNFEPPTPMRKRQRLAGSKYAKRKKEKDHDFMPGAFNDNDNYDGDGQKKHARVKDSAWDRAVKLQKRLTAEGPSFIKCMLHSHVVKGFWLGLPASFCSDHLLDYDVTMALEDEEGRTKHTTYKAAKTGLSAGWRGFAKQHRLTVGDVLVFKLVTPTRFKVYILRENTSKEEAEVTRVCAEASDDDSDNRTSEEAAEGLPDQDSDVHSGKEEESSEEDAKSKQEPEVTRVTGSPGHPLTKHELYKKALLKRALALQQLRALESSISIVEDALKDIDVQMEEMEEESMEKKDQAFRKLSWRPRHGDRDNDFLAMHLQYSRST